MSRLKRLKSPENFIKYASISMSVFAFDLALIFLLVEKFGIVYYISTSIAFLIATSTNYYLHKKITFKGSNSSIQKEYAFFMTFAIVGAGLLPSLMYFGVDILGYNYLGFRTFLAILIGLFNYTLNTLHTFEFKGDK